MKRDEELSRIILRIFIGIRSLLYGNESNKNQLEETERRAKTWQVKHL